MPPFKPLSKKAEVAARSVFAAAHKAVAAKSPAKAAPIELTVAKAADELYRIREERLEHDRESNRLKTEEARFRDYLIDQLPKGEASGTRGMVASAYVDEAPQYSVNDWGKFYAEVVRQYTRAKTPEARLSAFRFLNRAVSQEPMKEMWEDGGKLFPGAQRIPVKKVHLNKIAGKR